MSTAAPAADSVGICTSRKLRSSPRNRSNVVSTFLVPKVAAYRLAVLHATEDVENAFSALVKREEQATVLARGVGSLDRARSASFAAYQKGVVSLIEVLQADESLLRTSDAQAQAQTESARAAVAAFKALGGGWQPRGSEVLAIK
ncbi:TolC family protein [Vogesella sp. GCM10023246]|uniref:TolC family protein n=1 Tax=Vogesella oryzagri TaxID=3160864 RepID=A0ABV1M116_9NEIS